jgi:hypothetical protein
MESSFRGGVFAQTFSLMGRVAQLNFDRTDHKADLTRETFLSSQAKKLYLGSPIIKTRLVTNILTNDDRQKKEESTQPADRENEKPIEFFIHPTQKYLKASKVTIHRDERHPNELKSPGLKTGKRLVMRVSEYPNHLFGPSNIKDPIFLPKEVEVDKNRKDFNQFFEKSNRSTDLSKKIKSSKGLYNSLLRESVELSHHPRPKDPGKSGLWLNTLSSNIQKSIKTVSTEQKLKVLEQKLNFNYLFNSKLKMEDDEQENLEERVDGPKDTLSMGNYLDNPSGL